MSEDKDYLKIKIARKPWYEWLLNVLWLFAEAMFLQAAIASRDELEPRAALVYWLIFIVLLLAGLVFWVIRRKRLV